MGFFKPTLLLPLVLAPGIGHGHVDVPDSVLESLGYKFHQGRNYRFSKNGGSPGPGWAVFINSLLAVYLFQ